MTEKAHDRRIFWGCFVALVTTAFGFITRMFLIGTWADQFGLDQAQAGRLAGIGIWPFALSIIAFSLVIDRIGYKVAMLIAFVGQMTWAVMGVGAYFVASGETPDNETAYQLLYWGSLILGLANGTIEAFINPVVATMFSDQKTKWLNILHAGWPGGLVAAGMIVIFMGDAAWGLKVGIIAVPVVIYLLMLLPCKFPVQERVASGVSYREMLAEFGILGAMIVGFLLTLQLMDFFAPVSPTMRMVFIGLGVAVVVAFGAYTGSLGNKLMFFLTLLMVPLSITELGTDGWITGIMEGVFQDIMHPGWVLVYTSAIMMVLRFFAGPIVHRLSPLGMLAISAFLAIGGLYFLSFAQGAMIFVAATLYGVGKTFFWPTMLGVVAEQTPRGGALTLNAISGIGMLAVGTLGFPYIGALQADKEVEAIQSNAAIVEQLPGLVSEGQLTVTEEKSIYEVIEYTAISDEKIADQVATLPESEQEEAAERIASVRSASNQGALANMLVFPIIMLVCYLLLIFYFQSKGGYKAQVLEE